MRIEERRRAHLIFSRDPEDAVELTKVNAAIDNLDTQWQLACNRKIGELQSAMSTIDRLRDVEAIALPPVALPLGIRFSLPLFAPSPSQIASWWAALTPEQQLSVLANHPALIGNLDGIPAWARDTANRIQFQTDLHRLQGNEALGQLTRRDSRVLENLRTIDGVLAGHEAHADPLTGESPLVQLYIYEPYAFDGDGRVAISLGDLDTATHLAVTVPGLGTDVQGMGTARTQNIYDESRWASGESVAVLDWIGYDAPNFNPTREGGFSSVPGDIGDFLREAGDVAGVVNPAMARAGAVLLAADVAGLRAMRAGPPHLTVIGNSYGSTTTAFAATDYGLQADDVILTGSPGAGSAATVHDFTTGAENTWVGSASQDAVTYLGESGGVLDRADDLLGPHVEQLGYNPAMDGFGANRFQAEAVDRGDGLNFGDHGKYYEAGSESLYNVASIVTGNYEAVTAADHRYQQHLVEWQNPLEGTNVELQNPLDGSSVEWQNPFEGSSVEVRNPLEGSSVEWKNPLEGSSVSAGACSGPFGVPYPCVSIDVEVQSPVDIDLEVQSPLDLDLEWQSPVKDFDINLRNPVEGINVTPDDPEADRTPTEMSHAD